MRLTFYISAYVDGNLSIETKHMHYTFRDDINIDDFTPDQLYKNMSDITDICKREGITAVFVLK